jgi:hypothetical protein
MKTKISIIMIAVMLVCSCVFTSCSDNNDEVIITYTETDTIKKADGLFNNKEEEKLIDLCTEMALENKDSDTRENFLMYILAKATEIDEQNKEELYPLSLKAMKICMKQPVASSTITNGLRDIYKNIDGKLTELTKEFLKGKWVRTDNSSLSGMVVLVEESLEEGLIAKIISVPSKETKKFKQNDIKWQNINFANHEKFYFSDLASEETIETSHTGESTSKIINTYKGAVATIDFEKHSIKIVYTIKENVTSGARQTWTKEGFENIEKEEVAEEVENKPTEAESKPLSNKTVSGFFEE